MRAITSVVDSHVSTAAILSACPVLRTGRHLSKVVPRVRLPALPTPRDGSRIDLDGPHAGHYFHSSLLALMRADVKANSPARLAASTAIPSAVARIGMGSGT